MNYMLDYMSTCAYPEGFVRLPTMRAMETILVACSCYPGSRPTEQWRRIYVGALALYLGAVGRKRGVFGGSKNCPELFQFVQAMRSGASVDYSLVIKDRFKGVSIPRQVRDAVQQWRVVVKRWRDYVKQRRERPIPVKAKVHGTKDGDSELTAQGAAASSAVASSAAAGSVACVTALPVVARCNGIVDGDWPVPVAQLVVTDAQVARPAPAHVPTASALSGARLAGPTLDQQKARALRLFRDDSAPMALRVGAFVSLVKLDSQQAETLTNATADIAVLFAWAKRNLDDDNQDHKEALMRLDVVCSELGQVESATVSAPVQSGSGAEAAAEPEEGRVAISMQ
jgi:hypothetical protein